MSEFDQLIAKSKDDLAAIAVQFGDFTAEEASSKTKEELIAAITRTTVEEVASMIARAPKKKSRTTKKKDEEPKEEKVEKPEKKAPAKKTSRKTKKEAEPEEKAEAPAEEKVSEPAPKKKTSRKKKAEPKEEEKAPEAEVAAEKKDEEKEAPSAKKAPSKRGRKKKTDEPAEAKAEEAPSNEAPAETKETPEAPSPAARNSRKRRISFGPEQEVKEVAIDPAESPSAEENKAPSEPPVPEIQYTEIEGILSIGGSDNKNEYCGFIHRHNYLPGEEDAYVPGQMIKRLGLRRGDHVKGLVAPPRGKDKYAPLRKVLAVNGVEIPEDSDFDIIRKRPRFEHLTAIYPDERLTLETGAEDLSTRIIDLFCPIGKGQRGMIVSPPKAGKTILMQKIANSITANNPSCKVIVLLIDERPEEVTDMQRSIKGEVVYSTFDKRPENHVKVTELVLERAMRLVEMGEDVVILLDSMTRLARAYNLTINPTGRTLSGGLDPGSLYGPKRFFGAARNIEFGGSLTIIATALIETGSRMDEVIFEEFKGTGNMEVVLDRKLADRRMYPAIAVDKSGTRREDLLLTPEELESVWLTRKAIADVDTLAATEAVLNYMKRTSSNASFVLSAKKSFSVDS